MNDTIVHGDWRVFRSAHQLIPIGFVVFEQRAIETTRTSACGGGIMRTRRPMPGLTVPPPSIEEHDLRAAIRQSVESLAADAEKMKRAAEDEARELQEVIKLSMASSVLSSSNATQIDEELDIVFALQQRHAFNIQLSFSHTYIRYSL